MISNNVLDEVYFAMQENKKVIPVIHVDSKTPFRLQRLQHIDFTKNYYTGLGLLINELKSTASAESVNPLEQQATSNPAKSFYKKYAWLIASLSVLLVLATIFFFNIENKSETLVNENATKKFLPDTIMATSKGASEEPGQSPKDEKAITEKRKEKKIETHVSIQKENNQKVHPTTAIATETGYSTEDLAGDWKLVKVDPKAEPGNAYLKIEAVDEKKVAIKSYLQFYYNKTNDTSFLSIFNAFAGCNSCLLSRDMKLVVEDVSIGSQYYKIIKRNARDGGISADTVMNSGSNKSIRALVNLQFPDNHHAIIKVQQSAVTELSHGLELKPFIYTFRFSKID